MSLEYDPYEYEGDLAEAGYWDDDIDFDLDTFNDNWTSDFSGFDWDWDYGDEFGSDTTEVESYDDILAGFEPDGGLAKWKEEALVELEIESDPTKPKLDKKDGEKGAMDKLMDFLTSKGGGALAAGMLEGSFMAYLQGQSEKRADKLSDKNWERQQALLKLQASLRKSGGGGKPPVQGIAPKPNNINGEGDSKPGDFEKRIT